MDAEDEPEIIFSDYTQSVVIEGHHLDGEIYKTMFRSGWILSVENEFGTLTVTDNPPFFVDVLAWRAFGELVRAIKASELSTTRKSGGSSASDQSPQSQPGLRYLRSPPCQTLLPSAPSGTFLLCKTGDISEWRLHLMRIGVPDAKYRNLC